MEWTNDLIFEFLNLYQNEPSLWNASSPDHKNKNDAFEAWIRIKTNLRDGNISIKEIKKKKDNLMSTYRRQRSKVIDSMGTGQVYKPEWPFYNVMATFLNDVYVPRKTKSSEDLLDTEDYEENTGVDDEKNQNIDHTDRDYLSSVRNGPKRKIKRSKLREEDTKIHLEEAFDLSKHMNQNPDVDESSLYCVLLCKKLRGLKERTREIAMMEIDKVIYNLKHQEIQINQLLNGSNSMFNPQQPLQAPVSLQSHQYSPQLSTLLLSQLAAPLLQQSSQPLSVHQQTSCSQSSPVDQKPPLLQSPSSSHSFHSP